MVRSESVIRIVPGERFTPFSLAERIGAQVILESSSFHKGKERYSLLLVREAFQLFQDAQGIVFQPAGSTKHFKVDSKARDILDVCQYFANQHTPVYQDFPFPSGGVGYLSYEFSRLCDTIKFAPQKDSLNLPDAAFMFGHVFIIFDHYTDKLILIGLNYKEASINIEQELSTLEARLVDDNFAPSEQDQSKKGLVHRATAILEASQEATRVVELSDSDEEYKRRVSLVREEVIAGNLLQAVPSRRLVLNSSIKPIEAYRHLRSNNPSPYLFLLNFGPYQLFGSSPEVHVKVRDGKAKVRPIAGTRRRGISRAEDLSLEAELLEDPKERAEHLMLVDLGRNDLGRICEPGSVKVTDYMTVERYSHVMHIVSQVEGTLAAGKNGVDAFRATFPAGTVSGAPKIRAIEILSRIETWKRGFYAGAVGYIEPGGNLDTCIGIRCALKIGKRLVLQAGAGVVYDSTPERELEETGEKLAGVLRAVGVDAAAVFKSAPAEQLKDEDVTISVGFEPRSDAKEIQNRIDTMIDEKDASDQISNQGPDYDPWAEADAEAETLLNQSHLPAGELEEEIIPLDWDFDPASATGATEIQDDIDNLINDSDDSMGGRQ